jgi:hypothetical protein
MNNVKVIGIFPVAGFGFRFSGEDNQLQKPFVNIFGRSQIEWSVLYAKKNFPDLPITIAHRSGLKNEFMNFALHMRDNYKVILDLIDVGESTSGAGETIAICLKNLLQNREDFSFVSFDSDVATVIKDNLIDTNCDAKIVTFYSANPEHSFADVDRMAKVKKIVEKKMISEFGVIGNYYFKSAETYLQINQNLDWEKEKYISIILNKYVSEGLNVEACRAIKAINYGTPNEVLMISPNHFIEQDHI